MVGYIQYEFSINRDSLTIAKMVSQVGYSITVSGNTHNTTQEMSGIVGLHYK